MYIDLSGYFKLIKVIKITASLITITALTTIIFISIF